MAAKNQSFQIDEFVIAGVSIAFESGTAELDGAAGYEHEVVPSSMGDDFTKYKRVARTIKVKLQSGAGFTPDAFADISEEPIALRQLKTGRRAFLPKCSFAKMGAVGSGSVEVTFNILSRIQWL